MTDISDEELAAELEARGLERPELLSIHDYRSRSELFDREVLGFENAGSLHAMSEREHRHGEYVRDALMEHRPVHIENTLDYRAMWWGWMFAWYGTNGNIAVFEEDRFKAFPNLAAVLAQRRRNHMERFAYKDFSAGKQQDAEFKNCLRATRLEAEKKPAPKKRAARKKTTK